MVERAKSARQGGGQKRGKSVSKDRSHGGDGQFRARRPAIGHIDAACEYGQRRQCADDDGVGKDLEDAQKALPVRVIRPRARVGDGARSPCPPRGRTCPRSMPQRSAARMPIPAAPPSAARRERPRTRCPQGRGRRREGAGKRPPAPCRRRGRSSAAPAVSGRPADARRAARQRQRDRPEKAEAPTKKRSGAPVSAGKSAVREKAAASAAVLACTILPMPKAASAPSRAKIRASGAKPLPRARI